MPLSIANLGSSFAAGPGITPQIDRKAGRSGANYARLIASRLNAKLTDVSVSGATLPNLLDEPMAGLRIFPPQITGLPGDADIVFVLGGGNDLNYIGGLAQESLDAYRITGVIKWVGSWIRWILPTPSEQEVAAPSMEDVVDQYGEVLDAVHHKAPMAKVIVVEYLTLLGPDVKPGMDVPFDASTLARYKNVAEQLQKATAKAVQGREEWCARISVAELSQRHGIGAEKPWVVGWSLNPWDGGATYHPNAEGHKAVADMIYRQLVEMGLAK